MEVATATTTTTLASLRELVDAAIARTGGGRLRSRETWPSSLLPSGIPRGAISAVTGPGKTEFVTRFLAENPALKVAWVEEKFSVYPGAISQRRGGLERILFAESGRDSLWALLQILRSQLFNVVVFSSTPSTMGETGQAFYRDERTLRGLQLSAEKSSAAMLMILDEPVGAWPVSLQLQTRGSPELQVDILRQRW